MTAHSDENEKRPQCRICRSHRWSHFFDQSHAGQAPETNARLARSRHRRAVIAELHRCRDIRQNKIERGIFLQSCQAIRPDWSRA
ncbi:unnamed protein product, partial [Nesidiocoris tenuis]|uniref:Uncharacterized protein n=1 Tax=Nesidiocoris tenuis TaxID=355587 RepID=A0A6H5GRU5_9HEMI